MAIVVETGAATATGAAAESARLLTPEHNQCRELLLPEQTQSKRPWSSCSAMTRRTHGIIEWYDKTCIKVNRTEGPNLMIYKPSIKYLYKEGEQRFVVGTFSVTIVTSFR